jgi:uncharacterized protein (DUF169 family)
MRCQVCVGYSENSILISNPLTAEFVIFYPEFHQIYLNSFLYIERNLLMPFKKQHTVEEYQHTGEIIKERLGLTYDVAATKYIKDISEIPEGFIRPLKDRGQKMTICMAMAEARREGRKMAITVDDNPCTPMSVAQGWTKVSTLALLKSQQMNQWQKNILSTFREGVKRLWLGGWMAQTPFNRLLGHKGVLFAPLSKTPFIPDTVVVNCDPIQMTHVIQSLGFEGKHVPRAVLTGFGESCYLAGLIPMKSKKPVFALPGQGDRLYGCSDKNDLIMGMPGPMIFYLNTFLFKSGGDDYNLKNLLENPEPLEDLDESSRRGWAYIRKLIKA